MDSYQIQLTIMTHETCIIKLLALCERLHVKASVTEVRMGEDGLLRDVIITQDVEGEGIANLIKDDLTQTLQSYCYEVIDGTISLNTPE